MGENKLYVAVGNEIEEATSILNWAIMFTRGEICVIHVYVPAQNIRQPINGFRAPSWTVRDGALKDQERKVDKMLDDCIKRCARNDVLFENIIFEKESVTDGILELISKLGIRKLVMGAGANNIYLRRPASLPSRKSNYVLQHAPDFCHILFVSNGRLINTRGLEEELQKYRKQRGDVKMELQKYKKQFDKVKMESDDSQEASISNVPTISCEFSQLDLVEATRFYDPSLRIWKGYSGNVYKGFLHDCELAIQTPIVYSITEFKQEVNFLSKLHHPNVVKLIGACLDPLALIYEYLPNGSLEDRLSCKGNTPPLPWQTRISIATELCSVLNFLHSIQPCSIILGNVNPKNILLDANFRCKLSVFGHIIPNNRQTLTADELMSSSYTDPDFQGGHLSPKSDVYSFGIILLRLLTGRPALKIVEEVQHTLENGHLYSILDSSAGDWPVTRANHLAYMAWKCCHVKAKCRPDLDSETWSVLKEMMMPSESSFNPHGDKVPSYFICPISQEIMWDPHIAADGSTYEADAIRRWFDGGHDTSPMTNLKLDDQKLIPNRALRSAIQDWLQQHQQLFI